MGLGRQLSRPFPTQRPSLFRKAEAGLELWGPTLGMAQVCPRGQGATLTSDAACLGYHSSLTFDPDPRRGSEGPWKSSTLPRHRAWGKLPLLGWRAQRCHSQVLGVQ